MILLVIGLGAAGFLGVPAAEAARLAPAGNEMAGTSQTVGEAADSPVRLVADIGSAVQAQGRATTAGLLPKPWCVDGDWCKTQSIHTRDSDPGGELQWDPNKGRIRICDREADNHAVDAKIFAGSSGVTYVYRGGKGHCREGVIPNYDKNKTYRFKVCLITKYGEGWCNTSTNVRFPDAYCDQSSSSDCKGAKGESCMSIKGPAGKYCGEDQPKTPAKDPCVGLTTAARNQCIADTAGKLNTGGNQDIFGIGRPNGAKPPNGDAASIDDRPVLSRDNASGAAAPSEPINILLGWLKWTVLGACEVGVVVVGARAAIKHKRSEAGAHATGLAWVMIACVVAGSGLAFAFVSLVVNPL